MTLTEAYERRLAAFHEPTVEEFYSPGQPRAKDGKWTKGPTTGKMWSGVSARPGHRVAPKSKVTFPIEADTYETSKEARHRFAQGIYDADLGGGYTSRVSREASDLVSYMDTNKGVSIRGEILLNGRKVGVFERSLTIEKGKLVAGHDGLYINPSHQGSGIADRFNTHAVAEYQRMGVDRIVTSAGETVGGYAWARQGFRFVGPDQARRDFLHVALNRIQSNSEHVPNLRPHAAQLKKDVAALRKAIDAGEDVQPIHIASLGEKYARHTGRDDSGNIYQTWPGKSALLGTHWQGAYYFDANKAVTAAATDLEHAALRAAFRNETDVKIKVREEFYNKNHDPISGRFSSGFTSGFQHVSTSKNAGLILRGGFSLGAPAWDRSFGNGVYLSHEGDAKSTKFYARQGGRAWRDSQIVHGTVALDTPMRISGESHHALRSDMAAQLGGKNAVIKMAGDLYEHNAEIIRKVYREEFRHENPEAFDKLDLRHPEEAFMWGFSTEAGHRVTERLKAELRGGVQYPEENRQYRTIVENYDKVMAKPYGSDQWENFSEPFGNLVKRAGYDGLVIDTKRWGGVGGNQIVVFDPTKIKVAGARPYAKSSKAITAALGYALVWHELEHTHTSGGIEFACHAASCRPPGSGGTGGSLARGAGAPSAGPRVAKEAHLSRTTSTPNTTEFGRRINAMIDADPNMKYLSKAYIDADYEKKVKLAHDTAARRVVEMYITGRYISNVRARENYVPAHERSGDAYAANSKDFNDMQSAITRIKEVRREDYVPKNAAEKVLQEAIAERIGGGHDPTLDLKVTTSFGDIILPGVRKQFFEKSTVVDDAMEQSVIRIGHEIRKEVDERLKTAVDEPAIRANHEAAMAEIHEVLKKVNPDFSSSDLSISQYASRSQPTISVYTPSGPERPFAGLHPNSPEMLQIKAIVARTGIQSNDYATQFLREMHIAHQKVLTDVIGEVTQLGGRLTGTPKNVKNKWGTAISHDQVTTAVSKYPESWINESNLHVSEHNHPLRFRQTEGRAHYKHDTQTAAHGPHSEITLDGSNMTAIHEFAHRFERTVPGVRDLEARFHDRRTAGETEHRIPGYGAREVGKEDQFFSPYAGKTYKGTAYEILSMGYEHMHTSREWGTIDDDYKAFVLGTLVTAYRG